MHSYITNVSIRILGFRVFFSGLGMFGVLRFKVYGLGCWGFTVTGGLGFRV